MYDELVKNLRSVKDSWQTEEEQLMLDAADAIETLCNMVQSGQMETEYIRYIDGDELFRRIAGHSYYSGDDILTRICLMQEGKSPKNKSIESANVRRVVRAINKSEDGFFCSACSFGDFGGFHGYKPKYCPNCGAVMIEVQDGN